MMMLLILWCLLSEDYCVEVAYKLTTIVIALTYNYQKWLVRSGVSLVRQKKAFRDGDRSIGKKEYKAQRQAKRPVAVNKAASQKVKNVATKLTAAQAAGKDKNQRN